MPRYQISVRRPSSCWVHHCQLVHISTRCLNRGGRSCYTVVKETTTHVSRRQSVSTVQRCYITSADAPVAINAVAWSGWHQLEPSNFSYQVGWYVRPWCCLAGTVCLFGLSRKHHGAHFHLTSCSTLSRQDHWQLEVSKASTSPSPPVSTAQRCMR